MASAALQGILGAIESVTRWNPWGYTVWHGENGARAVATLANPGVLGMFLGIGICFALAVLMWGGPRRYYRLAIATLALCVPGVLLTLTRGPVLATTIAAILMLVLGHKRLLGVAAIAVVVLMTAAMWPSISSSELYEDRVRQSDTIQSRIGLQEWSLDLAEKKPLFGWGFGSFDRVKNTEELGSVEGIPIRYMLETTSHNTYLTFLVELGAIGLLLYVLPFLVYGVRAYRRARAPGPDGWIIAGSLGSLVVIVITAATIDFRFFSFAQMLPWLFLAIVRDGTLGRVSEDQS
jgi:O-antigen ligase